MAVVFAMLASYLLSRTLIPNMVHYLLAKEIDLYKEGEGGEPKETDGWNWKMHHAFNRKFDKARDHYHGFLDWALDHRSPFLVVFGIFVIGSFCLVFLVGEDFFPTVDSGQIRFHVFTPAGTRIEEAEQYFARVDKEVRQIVPPDELDIVLDNIGMPTSGINLAFGDKLATFAGITPLMAAAGLDYWEGEAPGPFAGVSEAERLEAVKLAIAAGNDVNAQADFGNYPMTGDPEYTRLYYPHNIDDLLDLGVGDPRWNGSTPLIGAIISGQPSLVQYLLDHGARPDTKTKLGWTPLMVTEGVFFANAKKEYPLAGEIVRRALADSR